MAEKSEEIARGLLPPIGIRYEDLSTGANQGGENGQSLLEPAEGFAGTETKRQVEGHWLQHDVNGACFMPLRPRLRAGSVRVGASDLQELTVRVHTHVSDGVTLHGAERKAAVESARLPALQSSLSGRPLPSTKSWVLVVRLPRLGPISCLRWPSAGLVSLCCRRTMVESIKRRQPSACSESTERKASHTPASRHCAK